MPETALPGIACESHVERLRAIVARRPFFIRVETINICNARCVFCAYRKTNRAPAVMTSGLFEKIVRDYVDLGGGAIGLTPIVGDVLLDPHLPDRLKLLRSTPTITHVSMITNCIAWDRYRPDQQRAILESVDCIDVSIGGIDATSYREMCTIDRFEKVRTAIHGMCDIKSQHDLPVDIHLGFRVNRPIDQLMADPRMEEFQRREITSIDGMNTFANWSGLVHPYDVPHGAHVRQIGGSPESIRQSRRNPCYEPYMNPVITANGLVRACACANPEARELILGDVRNDHLQEIWNGDELKRLNASFGTDALPDVCSKCTAYQDGEVWLHNPALAHFDIGDNPWDVIRKCMPPSPKTALLDTLTRLVDHGFRRLALYGAGRFTRAALSSGEIDTGALPIVAIIDDDPDLTGMDIAGIRIVPCSEALALPIDALVIASQWHPERLRQAALPLRDAGVHCVTLDQTAILEPASA